MDPAQQRCFDRRAFIMGTAAAATGLAVVGTPLAFAAEGDPVPPAGQWPYALLEADKKVGASYPSGRENCRNCHNVPAAHGQRRKRGQ